MYANEQTIVPKVCYYLPLSINPNMLDNKTAVITHLWRCIANVMCRYVSIHISTISTTYSMHISVTDPWNKLFIVRIGLVPFTLCVFTLNRSETNTPVPPKIGKIIKNYIHTRKTPIYTIRGKKHISKYINCEFS